MTVRQLCILFLIFLLQICGSKQGLDLRENIWPKSNYN